MTGKGGFALALAFVIILVLTGLAWRWHSQLRVARQDLSTSRDSLTHQASVAHALKARVERQTAKLKRALTRADALSRSSCFVDTSGNPRTPAALHGDIDGDGEADTVHLLGVRVPGGPCRYVLVVRDGTGSSATLLTSLSTDFAFAGSASRIENLNAQHGGEVVIRVDQGAYADIAQLFTVTSQGTLARIQGLGSSTWIDGCSVGNCSVFDCVPGHPGELVNGEYRSAGSSGQLDYAVTRSYYKVSGSLAVKISTQHYQTNEAGTERLVPDSDASAFSSC